MTLNGGPRTGYHSDGSRIFQTAADLKRQHDVTAALAERFECDIHDFGKLCVLDCYAEKHGRLRAVIEIKTREGPSAEYPNAWLSVHKWTALVCAAAGLRVRALFVVGYSDEIRWIGIDQVDARRHRIAGWNRPHRDDWSPQEPIIEVPVVEMHMLAYGKGAA